MTILLLICLCTTALGQSFRLLPWQTVEGLVQQGEQRFSLGLASPQSLLLQFPNGTTSEEGKGTWQMAGFQAAPPQSLWAWGWLQTAPNQTWRPFLRRYSTAGQAEAWHWLPSFNLDPLRLHLGNQQTYLSGSFYQQLRHQNQILAQTDSLGLAVVQVHPNDSFSVLWQGQSSHHLVLKASAWDAQSQTWYWAGEFRGQMRIQDFQAQANPNHTAIWLAQSSAQGQVLWLKTFDGAYSNEITGLAFHQNQLFLCGHFEGILRWAAGKESRTAFRQSDLFLACLDRQGQLQWVEQSLNFQGNIKLQSWLFQPPFIGLLGQYQGEVLWDKHRLRSLSKPQTAVFWYDLQGQAQGLSPSQSCQARGLSPWDEGRSLVWGFVQDSLKPSQGFIWTVERPQTKKIGFEQLPWLSLQAQERGDSLCFGQAILDWSLSYLDNLETFRGTGCLPLRLLRQRRPFSLLVRTEKGFARYGD